MNYTELADELASDVVTLGAIGSIAYLGLNGVTDTFVIGTVAGLGGYAVLKRRDASGTSNSD